MEYDELEFFIPPYKNYKPPSNFKDLTGTETEYLRIIGRAPNSNSGTMWNCQCKICGKYCVKLGNNIKRDKGCGCQKKKLIGQAQRSDLTNQRFGNLIALYYTGKSNSSRNAIWHCKCDCGNECDVDSNNLTSLHTTSCGCINYSIGAEKINNILKENHIFFNKEQSFKDLFYRDKQHLLSYDFAILSKDNSIIRLIEYDGIQHYIDTWGKWKTEHGLFDQQQRDQKKNQYAKEHNIPLIRIPYWERDNITLDIIMENKYLI